MNDVIVVGGGAAGMMAALTAGRAGARVLLIERNEKLGKKVYITGKGRCNLTNIAERNEFLQNVPRNPRFLHAAWQHLPNTALMELIQSLGVPLKVERGGRVFPASDKSSDVLRALERGLQAANVQVQYNTRVRDLLEKSGQVAGVQLEGGRSLFAPRVIVATGGASYPATGSSGDGWQLAQSIGHTTIPALPALSPIETVETWPARLSGLTLKNVSLGARLGKKKYSEQGELLMTHFGLSGPLALTLSSFLPENPAGVALTIDLKPALTEEVLDQRLLRDLKELNNKEIQTVMDGLAPHNLGLVLLELAGIDPSIKANSITAANRRAIGALLKRLPLTIAGLRDLNEAIITRGGVATGEINPSTMESKRLPGLYFAGELIDVDALTGGFNLQIAFSTGALAGLSAARQGE